MYNMVHGIKFGRLGVVINWGICELLVRNELIDDFRNITRVGCRINYYHAHGYNYWHFKHLQDAIDFMEWAMGTEIENENDSNCSA